MTRFKVPTILAVTCLGCTTLSLAQQPPTPETPVDSRPVMPVWSGKIPGTERPASQHESSMIVPWDHMRIIRNVTIPTMTVFLPKSNPSKTAVIVAPGGGFRVLAVQSEGYSVAEWFVQHGMAAIVLKYRLSQTPASDEEFMPSKAPAGAPVPGSPGPGIPKLEPLPPYIQADAVSDAVQAIKNVRVNAAKWGISPNRIMMVGFSAGGVVTSGAMLAPNEPDRPNYVGLIYGVPFDGLPKIPQNLPPAFIAVAVDDPIATTPVVQFFDALRAAKYTPEFHVYRTGAHGFSMVQRSGTSDHWIDELYWWMGSYGLTEPAR